MTYNPYSNNVNITDIINKLIHEQLWLWHKINVCTWLCLSSVFSYLSETHTDLVLISQIKYMFRFTLTSY